MSFVTNSISSKNYGRIRIISIRVNPLTRKVFSFDMILSRCLLLITYMNTNNDRQYLRLLSISHYVVGGIIGFYPLILIGVLSFIFLTQFFIMAVPEPFPMPSEDLPIRGLLDFLKALTIALLGAALAISTILSGRFLSRHKKYWFSFVIACILCLFTPLGTILGVFTIIVLSRQSVKELYGLSNSNNLASNQDDRD